MVGCFIKAKLEGSGFQGENICHAQIIYRVSLFSSAKAKMRLYFLLKN